jgi:hypothetical protein
MKSFITLLLAIITLHAGVFDSEKSSREARLANKAIYDSFRQNVSDANSIVKRGEYEKVNRYESDITRIINRVSSLSLPAPEKEALHQDLTQYAQLVNTISIKLQKNAPKLNDHYTEVLSGLGAFNKKMSSIGLRELLDDWRQLSKIKNRFVKKPSPELVKAFEQKWTSVTVMITELYLDEEMEEPLFAYLEQYKAYFAELSKAYRQVGYAEVAKLKPLSYKIKMQLELAIPYKS